MDVSAVSDWWYTDSNGNSTVTKVYFFLDGSNSKMVTTQKVEGEDNVFECEIPAGNFPKAIVTRANSDGSSDSLTQTTDITLDRSKNLIRITGPNSAQGKCTYELGTYTPKTEANP